MRQARAGGTKRTEAMLARVLYCSTGRTGEHAPGLARALFFTSRLNTLYYVIAVVPLQTALALRVLALPGFAKRERVLSMRDEWLRGDAWAGHAGATHDARTEWAVS